MTRPRITTCIRISITVLCLVACAALGWLWWRSLQYRDELTVLHESNYLYGIGSLHGRIYVAMRTTPNIIGTWEYRGDLVTKPMDPDYWSWLYGNLGFGVGRGQGVEYFVPNWFLMTVFAVFAYIGPWLLPWHRLRRFSLKTLLALTAIVSALLGLGVWLNK